MLKEKDLKEGQNIFRQYGNGGDWIDDYCDFVLLRNKFGGYSFNLHSEVDGSTEIICESIDDIEHLEFLFYSCGGELWKI